MIRKVQIDANGKVNNTIDEFNQLKELLAENRGQKKILDEYKKQAEISEKSTTELLAENREHKKNLDYYKKLEEINVKSVKKLLAENREQKKKLDELKKRTEHNEKLLKLLFLCIFFMFLFIYFLSNNFMRMFFVFSVFSLN